MLGGLAAIAWGWHIDGTGVMLAGAWSFLIGLWAAHFFTAWTEDEPEADHVDDDFGMQWRFPRKRVGM